MAIWPWRWRRPCSTRWALHKIETLCMATISDLIASESEAERISDAELKQGVDKMMEVACQVAIG